MLRRLLINEKPLFASIGYSHQQLSRAPLGTAHLENTVQNRSRAILARPTQILCTDDKLRPRKAWVVDQWCQLLLRILLLCGFPTHI